MLSAAKILIVGCGQLGSRHLQSLALIQRDLDIHIVDPFQESLDKAKLLFKPSEKFRQNLSTHTSLDEIKNTRFDVTINASTSQSRLEILKNMKALEILSNFLILEKVLFQNISDYSEALNFIDDSSTWVNCPRRMYNFYQDLKSSIQGPIQAKFQAANWGLCCNSVHYIDLIQYLTGEKPLNINTEKLKKEVFPTKREGYIELYGVVAVEFDGGSTLELTCTEEPTEWQLEIQGKNFSYVNQEPKGTSVLNQKHIPIRAPYQSELTAIIVEKLLSTGKCDLATYKESQLAHVLLIRNLLEHYRKITKLNIDTLPIT